MDYDDKRVTSLSMTGNATALLCFSNLGNSGLWKVEAAILHYKGINLLPSQKGGGTTTH